MDLSFLERYLIRMYDHRIDRWMNVGWWDTEQEAIIAVEQLICITRNHDLLFDICPAGLIWQYRAWFVWDSSLGVEIGWQEGESESRKTVRNA